MPRYPSRMQFMFCMAWLLFCMVAFSDAGFNMLFTLVALPVAVLWALVWLVRLVVYLKRKRGQVSGFKKSLYYWLFEPLLVACPLVLAATGTFSLLRFELSEQALSSYAEQVRAGAISQAFEFNHPSRWVGLYRITYTDLLPDGTVRVLTSSHGLLDRAGFVNTLQTPPPRRGEDSYKHIHQQWWIWYESW